MTLIVRTPTAVAEHFGCSLETAQRFCDLRDEGYSRHQAELMCGLSDPPDDDED